jgi:ABC-type dipeptide/oligopeptide/nickel transport system permease subunit
MMRIESYKELWTVIRSNKLSLTGFIMLIIIVFIAVFANYIAPYDPYQRFYPPFQPPSPQHLLGTDDVGHDIFSQLIYGTRISLFIGFLSAVIGTLIGLLIGLFSGFFGGAVDNILMRFTDMWLSLPTLLFTIFLVAILLRSSQYPMIYGIILAIALTSWPSVARLVRSAVLSIRERAYIEAVKALGASSTRIMFRHILPNVTSILVAEVVYRTSYAMLTEASLSFLGLGDPTTISWGMMLYYAMVRYAVVLGYWWWFIPPGIMISISVLSVMLVGMALEEYFNPRLRSRY